MSPAVGPHCGRAVAAARAHTPRMHLPGGSAWCVGDGFSHGHEECAGHGAASRQPRLTLSCCPLRPPRTTASSSSAVPSARHINQNVRRREKAESALFFFSSGWRLIEFYLDFIKLLDKPIKKEKQLPPQALNSSCCQRDEVTVGRRSMR